ncbi:MAG: arylsulfatase A-like enzyme [Spirosomataceae bacterium]|jgi:arylsulfatase A-like enzyme
MKKNFFLLAFFTVFLLDCQPKNEQPPNVIYVMADDLGYGDLGCYGQQIIKTPNLDKMATEGVRFTNFYAGNTVCAPSRCALMTGKHTGTAYVRGNKRIPLPAEEVTIAEFMKQHGYITGMFGKWGLGEAGTVGSPSNQGWDEFLGYTDQRHAHHSYTDSLMKIKDGKTVAFKHDSLRHSSLTITEAALDFIKNNQEKPFFMYWPSTIPHAEIFSPTDSAIAPYLYNGESNFEEIPYIQKGGTYRSQPQPRAAFAGMVSQLDTDMGKLFALLKKLELDKNTYVFFTSDNGPHQEGGADPVFFDSNGPLTGIKRDLYEGGIRVPMIAWAPSRIKANSVNRTPFAGWDFLPTVAEMIKKPLATDSLGVNGESFFNSLIGKKNTLSKDRYLYWEFHERGFDQAARKGSWKAIRRSKNDNKLELYNLSVDIAEANNVAENYPKIATKMAELLKNSRTKSEFWKIKE